MSKLSLKFLLPGCRLLSGHASVGVKPVRGYSHLTRNSEGRFTCTLIPGDGVGPELVSELHFIIICSCSMLVNIS